jgi:hypothetical protein
MLTVQARTVLSTTRSITIVAMVSFYFYHPKKIVQNTHLYSCMDVSVISC